MGLHCKSVKTSWHARRKVKQYHVYIMASISRRLYVGVTNNLERRLEEHRRGMASEFTRKYKLKKLVYGEEYSDPREAIAREKQIKSWRREKKITLIESQNPKWRDLGRP